VEKLSYKPFMLMMLLALILIGVFQFFELPELLDYTLLVSAILLGGIGVYKKFKTQ
jgi:fucose permease